MGGPGPERSSGSKWVVVRPVVQFAVIGLVAFVIVGLATSTASRRIGQREAIIDARTTTLVQAQGLVEPQVTDSLATGNSVAGREGRLGHRTPGPEPLPRAGEDLERGGHDCLLQPT